MKAYYSTSMVEIIGRVTGNKNICKCLTTGKPLTFHISKNP